MKIENGVVTNISESSFTEKINSTFDEVSKSLNKNKAAIVKTVAEFGFGMNSRAKVIYFSCGYLYYTDNKPLFVCICVN